MPIELADVQLLLSTILPLVAAFTGLTSNWTGQVHLSEELGGDGRPRFKAKKDWGCSISIHQGSLSDPGLFGTLVHECFHCFSRGLTAPVFDRFKGYEEGVVEGLTQLTGERIAQAMPISVAFEIRYTFDNYVQPLERLRAETELDSESFYLEMLRTPLAEREAKVVQWAIAAHPSERRARVLARIAADMRELR